jgi:hypothetical protein
MSLATAGEDATFSACMRKHGVTTTRVHGGIQFGSGPGLNPKSPLFRSAQHACKQLLSNGFRPTAAQEARAQRQWRAFSTCVRAHGIKDFPEPSKGGPPVIRPMGDLNPKNPRLKSAENACQGKLNGVLGGDKFLHDTAPNSSDY